MANVETKATREKQANHKLVDAAGSPVEDWEKATGIVYEDVKTKEAFNFQIPGAQPGSVQTMFALFGARTRATNTASANRNADEASGISDVAAIRAVFDGVKDGDWNASRGGGGFQIDLDKLCEAIGIVKKRAKQPFDAAATLARLTAEKAYKDAAMSVADVKAEYGRLTAKGGTTIADL